MQEAAPVTQVHPNSEMETGNRVAERTSAGLREMTQRAWQSTPDSKALGKIKKPPPKMTVTSYLTSTKSWAKYVKYTALPESLLTIPTEIVGFSNNPADSMPNTTGSTHQAKTRTKPKSRVPGNKRISHKK